MFTNGQVVGNGIGRLGELAKFLEIRPTPLIVRFVFELGLSLANLDKYCKL